MKAADDDARAQAQALSNLDQTLADGDQSDADLDQSAADADQTASERDQIASDRDQQAADQDQAISDRAAEGDRAAGVGYARSRRARSRSAVERDLTAQTRLETAQVRDEAAARRDRLADERDGAARARDQLAATLDAEIERLELDSKHENGGKVTGLEILMRAAHYRKRAAASRAQAAAQREAAAQDRERASQDRRQAALDRAAAAEELALEGIDHLTGVMRRRAGLIAIQRELDRTRRSGEPLAVAFVDVDGLKAVNDIQGHAAGDRLLSEVASLIKVHLRSYDVIARFGGDEFVCSLSGRDAAGARERFDQISVELAQEPGPTAITVGLAERRQEDTLEELIGRADSALIEARRRRGR